MTKSSTSCRLPVWHWGWLWLARPSRSSQGCRRHRLRRSRRLAGGDCRGQGNPDDEERQRDVRQRRSQSRRADQEHADAEQPQLPEGSQRSRRSSSPRSSPAAKRKSAKAWRKIYANEFTEQELKDLVTFYKSPLGQKLLATEPRAIQFSMSYMNQWAQVFAEIVNGQFRAEMHKRGKEI